MCGTSRSRYQKGEERRGRVKSFIVHWCRKERVHRGAANKERNRKWEEWK
jgi:hypothetical protein